MKYFSTFSGIGGFELGIEQAYEICNAYRSENRGSKKNTERNEGQGLQPTKGKEISPEKGSTGQCSTNIFDERPLCVGFSEIDKYAKEVYQKHFPNHKNYGDITKINEKDLPDFDLLVGGFPCQAFSIAGKRGGFMDTRGTLFFDIARIVREKQPRLLLLENVKGLLSHDKGNTFYTIISTLDELGYDCQWQVLNSKNHGVPQNRERVFIIGHLRGTPRPEVFPITKSSRGSVEKYGNLYQSGGQNGNIIRDTGICETLRTSESGGFNQPKIIQLNQPKYSNDRVYDPEGLSPTLNTMQGGNRQPFITEETKIRRLTPLECERLQGFPDGWTAQGVVPDYRNKHMMVVNISDTQRYKCLGNAVTVNVIRDIMLAVDNGS